MNSQLTMQIDAPKKTELTLDEWRSRYNNMQAHAARFAAMRRARINKLLREAHLDFTTVHNAIVSEHYGSPWKEVDYKLAHEANHLINTMFAASDIIRKWSDRVKIV